MVQNTGGGASRRDQDLYQWLNASPGRELVERESRCVSDLLDGLFGYYVLQVGWPRAFADCVAHSRIRHHITLEEGFPGGGAGNTLIGSELAFPVAGDSIDVVFLPHVLEFSADPHQVLRETERVLIPEGRLIVLGFNPLSSWGLWRLLRRRSGQVPWCGNFITPLRIADWLSLLGFDIEEQRPLMFLPPSSRASLLRRLQPLEPIGQRWLSMFSAAYAIRAVKRVSTLTPVRPSWKSSRSRLLPGQAVEPTTRGSLHVRDR
jgi:SAM-dependent methyltransferase